MKMILAIVSNDDSSNVSRQLTRERYSVTRLATTGGFLMSGNTTLLIGVEDEKVDNVIEIISSNSRKSFFHIYGAAISCLIQRLNCIMLVYSV